MIPTSRRARSVIRHRRFLGSQRANLWFRIRRRSFDSETPVLRAAPLTDLVNMNCRRAWSSEVGISRSGSFDFFRLSRCLGAPACVWPADFLVRSLFTREDAFARIDLIQVISSNRRAVRLDQMRELTGGGVV
jgi:hypothetical protein